MYGTWHDHVKSKFDEKAKLCYMDAKYCFIVYIKIDDSYIDIAGDVGIRFDNSNQELDKPFPKIKILKSNWNNGR